MLTVTTLEDRCNLVETTLVEQLVEPAASLYSLAPLVGARRVKTR